jgi:hypothetical protein
MEGKFRHQILPFAFTADDCFMGEFTSFNFVRIGLHSIRGCLENFLVWGKGDWSYSIFLKSHGKLPECVQNHSSIIKQQQNSAKPSNPITNFVHKKAPRKSIFALRYSNKKPFLHAEKKVQDERAGESLK